MRLSHPELISPEPGALMPGSQLNDIRHGVTGNDLASETEKDSTQLSYSPVTTT
jgi:hypothetical protein